MKYFLAICIFVFISSCAHKHENEVHHHHSDASSIPPDDHGGGKFTIQHRGETYYFDIEEDFLRFEEKLKREKKRTKCVRRGRNLVCGDQ